MEAFSSAFLQEEQLAKRAKELAENEASALEKLQERLKAEEGRIVALSSRNQYKNELFL